MVPTFSFLKVSAIFIIKFGSQLICFVLLNFVINIHISYLKITKLRL